MKVFLVTYELKNPSKDYKGFYETLKSAPKWWHYMDSTWLIATDETITEWSKKIEPKIDVSDYILIIEVNKRYWGRLPKDSWKWFKENLME